MLLKKRIVVVIKCFYELFSVPLKMTAPSLDPEWTAIIERFLRPFTTMDRNDPNNLLYSNLVDDQDIPNFLPPILDVEPVAEVDFWEEDYLPVQ